MTADREPGSSRDATDRDPVAFGAATPPGEWDLAVLGAAIVGVLLALLIHQGLTSDTSAPAFRTRTVSVATVGHQRIVTVEVTNTGGTAAAAIMVVGQPRDASSSTPDARAQIDHLAAGASTTVGLVVPSQTSAQQLHVRGVGFHHP